MMGFKNNIQYGDRRLSSKGTVPASLKRVTHLVESDVQCNSS